MQHSEVLDYLPDVIAAADSHREALGFFPDSLYADYARRGQLLVAVTNKDGLDRYVGHLLFDVRYPRASVRQVLVDESLRNAHVGHTLVCALKEHLRGIQFISIYARVAEDLDVANRFWERQDFYTQRVERGGISRNRMIVVRVHELNTPQLFESSGISASDPLGLQFGEGEDKPLYLLDLNVLFDLGPRRPRHDLAIAVFRAERMQACSLAISSEIEVELKRSATAEKTDPMQALAATLPKFPLPPSEELEKLVEELGHVVFPRHHSLGANDKSDLKHLATAIHNRLPGLVTSDTRVQESSAELRRRYGIEAISPQAFLVPEGSASTGTAHTSATQRTVALEAVSPSDEPEVRQLLLGLGVDASALSGAWAAVDGHQKIGSRFAAKCDGRVVGYLVWPHSTATGQISAHMAVVEDTDGAQDSVRSMLNLLTDQVAQGQIARIKISCLPRQALLKEIAAQFGYTSATSRPNELHRVVVKRLITEENWTDTRQELNQVSEIQLPELFPIFRNIDQQLPIIRPDKERVYLSISRLESLLSPALFCLPGRGGVLVPIQRQYAEQLLPDVPQTSLLPKNKAQLFAQKIYVSGISTLKRFERGDLMFFYESEKQQGAGAVIAVARVARAYGKKNPQIMNEELAPSILETVQLNEIGTAKSKTITVFENSNRLTAKVSLTHLRSIGCGEPHQLLSTQKLSTEQIASILKRENK